MASKILVVDDDLLMRRTLKYRLEREGYAVTVAETGEDALTFARHDRPDLVLLDIGLPGQDGLTVARVLGREMSVPIIFLTARREEMDIVVGLELGAEDYVTKPFGMRELFARIRVVLRRVESASTPAHEDVLALGQVVLDAKGHTVHVRGKQVDLPPKEFELLRLLMANAGTVLTTEYLLDAVWGEDFTPQVLYVRIGWLRELIEEDPRHPHHILTARGIGYKFNTGGDQP